MQSLVEAMEQQQRLFTEYTEMKRRSVKDSKIMLVSGLPSIECKALVLHLLDDCPFITYPLHDDYIMIIKYNILLL